MQLGHLALALEHHLLEQLLDAADVRRLQILHALGALGDCRGVGLLLILRLLHREKLVLVLLARGGDGLLVDEAVVEVLDVLEVREHVRAVLGLLAERVAHEVDRLQVLEWAEVHHALEVGEQVVADGEQLQLRERAQAGELGDAVGEEREIRQVRQRVEKVRGDQRI